MLARTAVLLSLLTLGRSATAGPACVTQAKADAAQADAQKANEARFATSLAAKKLKPITLESVELGQRGIYAPTDFKIDRVTTAKFHGSAVKAITWLVGSCGGSGAELAQQGTKIFRIERKPTAKTTAITVCGCPIVRFTCGGARVTVQPIGFVLPAGTTFDGVVEIAYAADTVTIEADRPCPPVAPPP